MPRIAVPDGEGPIHLRALSLQPALTSSWVNMLRAVHEDSILSQREREAARYRIAIANGCRICAGARLGDDIPEGFYEAVAGRSEMDGSGLTQREILSAEFAERFAVDHHALDDEFFERLKAHFSDAEILDLSFCCARNTGFGRMTHVLGLDDTCDLGPTPSSLTAYEAPARSVPF